MLKVNKVIRCKNLWCISQTAFRRTDTSTSLPNNIYMSDFIFVSADINCHVTCHNMFVSHWCSQHTRGRISIFTSVRFASSVTAYDKKHKITDIHYKQQHGLFSPILLLSSLYFLLLSRPVSVSADFSLSLSKINVPPFQKQTNKQKIVYRDLKK